MFSIEESKIIRQVHNFIKYYVNCRSGLTKTNNVYYRVKLKNIQGAKLFMYQF